MIQSIKPTSRNTIIAKQKMENVTILANIFKML